MSPGIGGGGGREEEEGRTHCTCKGATHPGRRGVMLTLCPKQTRLEDVGWGLVLA